LLVYKVYSSTNDPSMGVLSHTTSQTQTATNIGLTTPDSAAPSGFLNLLALYSARALSALFHAESVPGVMAFRGFPLPEATTAFTALCPSCPRPRVNATGDAGFMHLGDPFTTDQFYPGTSADPLLAFCPSEDFSPRVLALHFSKASSHGLSHNAGSLHRCGGSPKFQRTRG
jgi:hypothetical protein